MKFEVGAFEYQVIITDAPPDVDGEPQAAAIDHMAKTIEIYKHNRGDQRLRCLLHELRHAWVFRFGGFRPNEEDDAEQVGHFTQWAMAKLSAQGGQATLDDMLSEGEVAAAARDERMRYVSVEDEHAESGGTRHSASVASGPNPVAVLPPLQALLVRPDAPCCGGYIPDRAIEDGKPVWDEHVHIMQRACYCDACEAVSIWHQPCTAHGRPIGNGVWGLRILRDADAHAYLADHSWLKQGDG